MFRLMFLTAVAAVTAPVMAGADGHAAPMVVAQDQSVAGGVVSAAQVIAAENGWMVVHRTDGDRKPGVVVGYAPLRAGENTDVAAILTETVAPGEQLMLMVHAEVGGLKTGIFEYSLGAKEDGPIRIDDKLVMQVVTAQ